MPQTIAISAFVEGLRAVPPEAFTRDRIHDYILQNPVSPQSLEPYIEFSSERYTRHLVHRDALFEVLVLCWAPGQTSPIHDHAGQMCWMAVPVGALDVRLYRVNRLGGRIAERIAFAGRIEMDPEHPGVVTDDSPIHSVENSAARRVPAVSLHVYSRPIERCTAFDVEREQIREIELRCDSAPYGFGARKQRGEPCST